MNKNNKITWIYSFLICVLPFLSIYKSPINGFSLGDVVIVITFFVMVFKIRNKKIFCKENSMIFTFGIFLILLITLSIIDRLYSYEYSKFIDTIVRSIKILFYILTAIIACCTIGSNVMEKNIKILGIIASMFVIIQFLLSKVGVNVFFVFRNMIYSNGIYDEDYYKTIIESEFVRSGGLFLEPSHFCQYAIVSLILFLFKKNKKIADYLLIFVCALAMIISGSIIGFICLAVTLFLYFIYLLFISKNKSEMLIVCLIILCFSPYVYSIIKNSDFFEYAISRTEGFTNGKNVVWNSRMKSYLTLFETNNNAVLLFGNGWGNTKEFLFYSSIAYILHCCGLSGTILFGIGFISICVIFLLHKEYKYFTLSVITMVLLSMTEIITNIWIILFFSLIFIKLKNVKNFNNEKTLKNMEG